MAAKPTVLVVEDVALVRMLVAAYLRESDFQVIEAGNTGEAIRVLSSSIAVDIVFADVNMPDMEDGFALARWARENRPTVKVVLGSGMSGTADKAAAFGYEGPIIAKPYEQRSLVGRLRAVLAEKS